MSPREIKTTRKVEIMPHCRKQQSEKSQQGFTMVEVIIVLVMIGVMSAIAIPGIMKWLPDYRLKSAARDLYSNFQQIRIFALKENKEWAIVFDVTNNRYYLCSDDGADNDWSGTNDNIGTGDNTIYQTVDLQTYKSGIKFAHGEATLDVSGAVHPGDDVTYAGDVVVFNSRGTGSAGYAYLDHQENSTSYVVGTLTSGSIQLKKWKATTWE